MNSKDIDLNTVNLQDDFDFVVGQVKIRKLSRVMDCFEKLNSAADSDKITIKSLKPAETKSDIALCHECGKKMSQSKINWHLQLHKRTRYLCSLCLGIFKKYVHLTQHKQKCSKKNGEIVSLPDWFDVSRAREKIFSCPLCPEELNEFYALLNHMSVHDLATETFTCGPCMRAFYQMSELKKHMFIHVLEDQQLAAKEGKIPEESVIKSADELKA